MSASSYFGFNDQSIVHDVFSVASEIVPEMRVDDTAQVTIRMGAGYYLATIYSEREATIVALEEAEVRIDEELQKRRIPAVVLIQSKHSPSSASSQKDIFAQRGAVKVAVAYDRRFIETEQGVARESQADASARVLAEVRHLAPSAMMGKRPATAKGDFVWINLEVQEYRAVAEQLPSHVVPLDEL